jgi:Leucine-rich repeat (LRR) protein
LGELPLTELPAELGDLGGLEALALGDDYVTDSGGEFCFKSQGFGMWPHEWKRQRELTLSELGPVGCLKKLRRLSLHCVDVADIAALGELSGLEWLDMGFCTADDLSPLARLAALKYLDLGGDSTLDLSPLSNLAALEHLDLEGRPVRDLSALSKLPNLQQLSIETFGEVDLASLHLIPRLKKLTLKGCRLGDGSQFRGGFKSLRELDLTGASLSDLTVLSDLANLRSLKLAGPKKLADLAPLAKLTRLELLDLTMCKRVRDLGPLAELPRLKTLMLAETGVRDFAPLERMKALKSLDVREMPLCGLEPFARSQGLEILKLGGCHNIREISLLADMPNLRELDLSELTLDLTPLAKLKRLEKLNLFASRVNDLSPLRGLKRLRCLSLWSCHAGTGAAVIAELSGLKELTLFGFSTDDPCPAETLVPLLDQLDVLILARSKAFPVFDDKLVRWTDSNHLEAIKTYFAARDPAVAPVAAPARERRPARRKSAVKRFGPATGVSGSPAGAFRKQSGAAPDCPPGMSGSIREKLEWLSRSDANLWPFGASEHAFRIQPPLSEAELQRTCANYAIELPEDFRHFLLEVGSGGAGPGYGLERFGFVESTSLIPKGQPKTEMVEVVRGQRGRIVSRSDLFDEQGRKVEWFNVSFYHTIANLAADGTYGPKAPARPFPLTEPLDGEDKALETSRTFGTICPADGVWTLANYGCGMVANLVLNGPFRGQVWFYDPNEGSYQPFAQRAFIHSEECPVLREQPDPSVFTYVDWYKHWLDYTLLQVSAEAWGQT